MPEIRLIDEEGQQVGVVNPRDAQLQKIPFMLVCGKKEAEAGTVSVRSRSKGDLGPRPLADFEAELRGLADSRAPHE